MLWDIQNKCNVHPASLGNAFYLKYISTLCRCVSVFFSVSTQVCVCHSKFFFFFCIPSWACGDKAFFSELRGQLLDTVQPHTYSNSLIHKSHRLTLGSPRCPDRWEQKPREESRQEEEEVSESWGRERERERGVLCSARQARWHAALWYSFRLSSTLFIVSHGLSITQAQSH